MSARVPLLIAVDAGFSRSRGFWPTRIRSTTTSWCSHCMLRFRYDTGASRIFESRVSTKGFVENSTDMYTPENWSAHDIELVEWVSMLEDPQDTRLYRALALCEQWMGVKSYPIYQLAFIWAADRYHTPVPRSDDALICSEAVAVIAHEVGIDLRDEWHPNWDAVTPGSAWNNLMAHKAGYRPPLGRAPAGVTVARMKYRKYTTLQGFPQKGR